MLLYSINLILIKKVVKNSMKNFTAIDLFLVYIFAWFTKNAKFLRLLSDSMWFFCFNLTIGTGVSDNWHKTRNLTKMLVFSRIID